MSDKNLKQGLHGKYFVKDNTFFDVAKTNPMDLVEKEIGDSKTLDKFLPQQKITRWDNEANVSIRLVHDEKTPDVVVEGDDVVWKGKKVEARFYDVFNDEHKEGAGEFEIVLKEKPLTNVVEFTVVDKDVEYFYQAALTAEEIAEGASRPENVVGSYAVYAKSQKTNYTGDKEYKVGKIGHIYRPRIEDSVGTWVWGDLHIENGILSVTIPQDFLENAVYPVRHAAGLAFGYTSNGATNLAGTNYLAGTRHTVPADIGTLVSLRAYKVGTFESNWKGVITDSSRAIITDGVGNGIDPTVDSGWNTLTYSPVPTLSASTDYFLCLVMDGINAAIGYDTGGTTNYGNTDSSNSYTTPTNPSDGTLSDRRYAIYAVYTPTGTFPVLESVTDTDFASSVTSMAVNMPATVNAGDRLIALCHVRNAGTWSTVPTGWTNLAEQAGGGSVGELSIFEKVADGTEDGGTATWVTGTGTSAAWQVIRISGAHASTASEVTTASGDSSSANPPSETASWGGSENNLWLAVAGHSAISTTAFSAAPAGFFGFAQNGASSGGAAVCVAHGYDKYAGATYDPGTFTTSGSNRWWSAATIVVRPASAGSTSPSQSPSASLSPSISPSQSPSASLSPSRSPSLSPSQSPSASLSPSRSPSLSPSISPSQSPSASLSPSRSPSLSPSISPSAAPGTWYNGDCSWPYRVKVTALATKVDADLTAFPVYVDLNLLPAGFHTHVNQTDARDIRVTTSDGTTEVPREVVFYTAASDTGELHFKGTLSNSTDTDFYIYYGNAGASEPARNATYGSDNVWTNSYKQVYHLQQDPSGNGAGAIKDSTSNAYDLTPSGSPVNGTGKLAGNAVTFDGTNDQLKNATAAWVSTDTAITVSLWSNFSSANTGQNATIFRYTTSGNERNSAHAPWSSTDYWDFGTCCASPGRISGSNTAYDDKYSLYHFTGGANHEIYIDGVSRYAAGSSDAPNTTLTGFALGSGIDAEYHKGTIDEFRVATAERTSTWISTENNNQSSPSTFFTIGAEVNCGSASPSFSPSQSPSASLSPSLSPSISPSQSPSASLSPSISPSISPSQSPSASLSPSISPSQSPSASLSPSLSPSVSPSQSPSASLSPSISPSSSPSQSPSASISPSLSPSISPSQSPSASLSPSLSPSISPSQSPSASLSPSISPSASPSQSPSASLSPSVSPSSSPSQSPSASLSPSLSPSISPSQSPSASISPSVSPSASPSQSPSASLSPSASPSLSPSQSPSASISPSISPSIVSSISPSLSPSLSPSISPSQSPSASISPSRSPSISPSQSPSASLSPSLSPSASPSQSPSASLSPSQSPSLSPSQSPSASLSPSLSPSVSPSQSPSSSISPSSAPYSAVLRRWDGSTWVKEPLKVWNGSTWVTRPASYWTGSTWEPIDTTGI